MVLDMEEVYSDGAKRFKEDVLFHRIIEWSKRHIKLDNGKILAITGEDDCCAWANGLFSEIKTDVLITDVVISKEKSYSAELTLLYDAGSAGLVIFTGDPGNEYYAAVATIKVFKNEIEDEYCIYDCRGYIL